MKNGGKEKNQIILNLTNTLLFNDFKININKTKLKY